MAMGTGTSGNSQRGPRGRNRLTSRQKGVRRPRVQRIELEGLETRTLLATIPAALATGGPVNLGGATSSSANENSPIVVVDPLDPRKVAAVWVNNDPTLPTPGATVTVQGAYSTNGGTNWLSFSASNRFLSDPNTGSTTSPPVPYTTIDHPSIGFDRNNNLYVLAEYHTGTASGALVLEKYNFSGDSPAPVSLPTGGRGFGTSSSQKIVYQWINNDPAFHPTMQVDSNVGGAGFTDPTTGQVQNDPYSGNVYISWASADNNPAALTDLTNYNPNRTMLLVSSDGGVTFGGQTYVNNSSNGPTKERDTSPTLVINQGRPAGESGQTGDPGIPAGTLTVGWDDFGTLSTASTPQDQLLFNTVTPGRSYGYNQVPTGAGGGIGFGTTTTFTQTVSVPSGDISALRDLSVTLAVTHPNVGNLKIELVAPDGVHSILLVMNQVGAGGTSDTTTGISGQNLGIATSGIAIGTTFSDNATRDIFDPTNAAPVTNANASPYIGNFRPESDRGRYGGLTLDAFLAQLVATGDSTDIDGTWTLRITDTSTNAPTSPQFLNFWTLNLSTGLQRGSNVSLAGSAAAGAAIVVQGSLADSYPRGSNSTPLGIGPGLVMAVDNTLGSFSPYEGRIYAAFVGWYNIASPPNPVNPADNTDIFLLYSDDAGRSWRSAGQVNTDQATVDGHSQAVEAFLPNGFLEYNGRPQFQPAVAVDQATGTLVVSWRDARDDAAGSRVATYITSSIDGGASFSDQSYANPDQVASDAITGKSVVMGPRGDNQSGGDGQRDSTYGYGSQMGLAVSDGQVYPVWAGNFNQGHVVNGAIQGDPLSIYYRPMTIAAGPRVVNSSMGPIAYPGPGGTVSFDVYFDRPIDPPGLATPTFRLGDVQVFYHDTNSSDAFVPLRVTGIVPDAGSGVGPGNKFGFTHFTVTFDPNQKPGGASSGITNFTGTYSYLIAPDSGGTAISSPIRSFVNGQIAQADATGQATNLSLPIPSQGTGGTGTSDDRTTSTIALSGHANQFITGVDVSVRLNHTNDGDLTITLIAPDGRSVTLYSKPGDNGQDFGVGTTSTIFSDSASQSILSATAPYLGTFLPFNPLGALDGGPVDGTWTLRIVDSSPNNAGTLLGWSIKVHSSKAAFGEQDGAPMDQNADGTPDQNPLTTAFNGFVPGDVYAAPAPQPPTKVTFSAAAYTGGPFTGGYIFGSTVYDQNTLPLLVPGPQATISVPGSTGSDHLVLNGTNSSLTVTFDRPMQVNTFTSGDVLQIMGPLGPIAGPQAFTSGPVGLSIDPAPANGPSVRDSTITVPSFNHTFKVAKVTVQLNIDFTTDSALSAVLKAPGPGGTTITIPLFANVGGSGADFTNTVFDDAALTSITAGTAPFAGSFKPSTLMGFAPLNGIDAEGAWTLELTNNNTGATGTLKSWSLNITPQITVTPVNPVNGTATAFTVAFPQQQLSGTYTIQLSSDIQDGQGQHLDTNQNAGLDALRGQSQNGPTTTVNYSATGLPKAIPAPGANAPGEVASTITVPDNFFVQGDTTSSGISGLRVQINLTYPNDPDLSATLYYNKGQNGEISVPLFSNVGGGVNTANFTNTVFDDNANTPISSGGAPFFATFAPQGDLGKTLASFAGVSAKGTWTLVVQNNAQSATTGKINGWSLSFQKPLPTTGLGEPGGDNATGSFRIFNLSPSSSLSSQTWTPVGPADINGRSGRIGGLAMDPSDPTGNTVYVGGASGGIWKTTNFLTTDPLGPTYVPLTDFGPTNAINIGSIAVFGRNHDPNQSLIVAATGEGDSPSPGVGFLISQDGGASWTLYDSTNNVDASGNLLPIDSAQRDRAFVGSTAFKVVIDPQLTSNGQVIIYAALSGNNGGIWRSEDTGETWQLMRAGQATDVVLDPSSSTALDPNTDTKAAGNLQIVYAAFRSDGVYISPNQGQVWNQMSGVAGNGLIVNTRTGNNVNPAGGPTPNGTQGRIVLAVPASTGNAAQDAVYSGWLYAAVADPNGALFGLFLTKDFGQNWTKVRIPTLAPVGAGAAAYANAVPSNNVGLNDYSILGGGGSLPAQGNYDIALAVDPTNPNVVYLGGDASGQSSGLIRVDSTAIWDAHSLVAHSNIASDNGALDLASTGPAALQDNTIGFSGGPYLNLIRKPGSPFVSNSRINVFNYAQFTNNGFGVDWIPFDLANTDYHRVYTMVDPTTGLPRIIFGNDQGVWSGLDNNGTYQYQIGSSTPLPDVDRNGNLQITQFYYGAAQPSAGRAGAAAQVAAALFYGSAQDNGGPASASNLLTTGDLRWSGPGGDATGIGTDQQGGGTAYQYFWPCCGGNDVDFFQFIGTGRSGYTGRTFGLIQGGGGLPTPDTQWPLVAGANFAVDPVNSQDVVISSSTGRIFSTQNGGVTWLQIGDPSAFGSPGSFSNALAYGAPDPSAPSGIGNLGNFIYVGTRPPNNGPGRIFVTQVGGGAQGNQWSEISLGLSGGGVQSIVTDPIRGTHDAYAVTASGVFYLKDSVLLANDPTNTQFQWVNITGNIHNLAYSIFGQSYDPTTDPSSIKYNQAASLNAIAADWRYTIPNNPANLAAGYHPVLYVGSNSGVYQSLDNGQTWSLFPTTSFGALTDGGNLPHVSVTDLDLALGNIDKNTGMSNLAGPYDPNSPGAAPDPDLLLATTFGRGSFAINLAPMLFPGSVNVTNTSGTDASGNPIATGPATFNGLSAITAFGNATWITIRDVTDPAHPILVGGFDATKAVPKPGASNSTDAKGHFAITVDWKAIPNYTNGKKTFEIFATDDAGSVSNKATITLVVNDSRLPQPPPTAPPSFSQDLAMSPADIKKTIVDNNGQTVFATTNTTPTFIGVTNPGVTLTEKDGNGNTIATTTSDPATGAFSFQFPNPSGALGQFEVYVTAKYTQYPGVGSTDSDHVVFQIVDNSIPNPVGDFRLDPASDTGIVGDNVTSDRKPMFIGTTTPGNTVELFVNGQPAVQASVTALSNTFSIQLPFSLTSGQTSLYVKVINAAGNTSGPSNTTAQFTGTLTSGSATVTGITNLTGHLAVGNSISGAGIPAGTTILSINSTAGSITLSVAATASGSESLIAYQPVGVAIVSTAADYNGTPPADPALFTRNTASNQLQWLVQTKAGSSPPWFGPSGVLYSPSAVLTGTLTGGSATVTGLGSTRGLSVGQSVTGTGIPAGTTIAAINNATTIRLSANATAGGSKSLTFTGPANVVPFEGDFDGDGITDLATYNLATATWTVLESSNYTVQGAKTFSLGTANSSLPVVGHFDPNGPSEEAVFTVNAQGQGVWNVASVITGTRTFTFGQAGDVPLAGAFDALGYDEPAVYRPSTGQFLVLNPTNNQTVTLTIPGLSSSPDLSSLVPVPGQYDNSKPAAGKALPAFGRTEPAVFDPKTGVFTILGPNNSVYTVSGFQPGDIPAPADYLNLGSDQVAVFRPSSGQFIGRGSNGQLTTLATLGQSGDIPITAPLAYRVPGSSVTPTPTTPTPTPTTPTPTPTTPTPTPTSTPPVTVSSVQLVTNRKHRVTEILVGFNGALNAAEAQNLGIYHLTVAGKHGSFTAKNARTIKLKQAVYNPANDTVALFARKPFALSKKVQLLVNGTPPSGLGDSHGRLIDGDHNGQPGGNAVALLSRGGVSMAAVAFGPTGAANGGVSAATVDALMELNALAGAAPSQRPGRKRQ